MSLRKEFVMSDNDMYQFWWKEQNPKVYARWVKAQKKAAKRAAKRARELEKVLARQEEMRAQRQAAIAKREAEEFVAVAERFDEVMMRKGSSGLVRGAASCVADERSTAEALLLRLTRDMDVVAADIDEFLDAFFEEGCEENPF